MKNPFKKGKYLNAWGKAFIAIELGKTPDGITAIYKSKMLDNKITETRAKKWNKMWREFIMKKNDSSR